MSLIAADSTFGGVHDFFHSHTWYTIRNVGVAFVILFWLGVAFWVFKDARRRIRSPWLVGLATLLGLFPPFLGAFVYMLFRPPEYLEDVRERELRDEGDGGAPEPAQQPVPRSAARRSSRRSSSAPCARRVSSRRASAATRRSRRCWQVCPFCETPVESTGLDLPVVEARPRRRRRSTSQ